MEMIGDLGLEREFNASKCAEKLSGVISLKLVNGESLLPPYIEYLRFMQTASVQFYLNIKGFFEFLRFGHVCYLCFAAGILLASTVSLQM